jgi:hypothetical protein
MSEKKGQIAHLDRDPSHNDPDNLAFLCLEHHDQYDSRPSQSKGLTPEEVKRYRAALPTALAARSSSSPPDVRVQASATIAGVRPDDPMPLAPQFEPLFRRAMFIINIDESSFDAQGAEAKAKELVAFVSALEMGSFYGKEIARLVERPKRAGVWGRDTPDDVARKRAKYFQQLCEGREQVIALLVELLRYQKGL